ncbi:hypothetical protein [Sphingobacterium sp.]|uniref:hypothetical protein n=1 Tax=Sphingobacterium sp. TaxID=341027 RepID=UPI0025903AE1|nr:hypothetical protein [Sphingobacterium sp.]WET69787.1 MAG: hypothetical protein P0Y57_01600 [Sphingobacterium sp.]
MKLDYIKTVIAIAISCLISYGFFVFTNNSNKELLSVGTCLFLSVTLVCTLAIQLQSARTTTLVKTVSSIFFVCALIINIAFLFIEFKKEIYIILTGIVFLVYVLLTYSVSKHETKNSN